MFYTVLRFIATLSLKIYFKKIYLSEFEKIPKDQANIFICNHPNGFFEPCIIACFLPRNLHYLVRGDLFSNPLLKGLLRMTHQIPIYRFKDGFSNLKKNNATIENCREILKQRKSILIFAEGSTQQVRWIRPLQKGTARIALGTISSDPSIKINIIPIGIHFTKPAHPRSEVMIHIGDSISLDEYIEPFKAKPAAVVKQLTDDLLPKLTRVCVHLRDKEDAALFDQGIPIFSPPFLAKKFPIAVKNIERYSGEYQRSRRLNKASIADKQLFSKSLEKFHGLLSQYGINVESITGKNSPIQTLYFILGFPFFVLGLIFNGIPIFLAKKIADKYVTDIEFYSSIFISSALGIYFVYFVTIFVILVSFYGLWGLAFLIAPFLGYYAIIYFESLIQNLKNRKFNRLTPEAQNEIESLRTSIVNFYNS